jgi:phosphoenolpyruvate synthase/pyruvate phosphate dikinase
MEDALQSFPDLEREYSSIVAGLDDVKDVDLSVSLKRLREIVGGLELPQNIEHEIIHRFGRNERLIVRSSSNCEDGYNFSGAGVYDSVANVKPRRIADAVRTVWASLWNVNAVLGRRYSGISHGRAHMAVLIQHMVVPEYSFIIHTLNPSSNNPSEILIECALGLGETLASGETPGSPFRMIFDKVKGKVQTLAFASFSTMAAPGPEGKISRKTIDYASVGLSTDTDLRNSTGILIGETGRFIEDAFGGPQDIEGLISGGSVFLVQARPQKGIT